MRWFWLSLMSFTLLVMLLIYETRWVSPEIDRYFSQSNNLTGQQLATRSREFLHEALAAFHEGAPDDGTTAMHLEMAYSFMDIGVYRENYPCTGPSLSQLNRFMQRAAEPPLPSGDEASTALLPILECLTAIEMGQLSRRSQAAAEFADNTRRHQFWVMVGSVLIYLLGLVFWLLHERQRRVAEQATQESLEWMKRALHDPLTGVSNRSALHERVETHPGDWLGMILVDIDYFKQYNDTLGHPEGDQLLRQLASLIDVALKGEATLYRMGGDEFAALFPCDSEAELRDRCQELIARVHSQAIPHPGHPERDIVTLSIGGTYFQAASDTFPAAYASADHALYAVKARGRDGWQVQSCMETVQ
ncbi:GGDEF domain-containing protein [Aidingimonas lacisalsi]|uniref:GGDEF domain-containing protein n=1 Tax=Aidingimonas lacisalsi TaxID=2604086 RepID=UPI001F44FC39|nr:GGDEF domain-containing protein [Aidingimonas lacisalsi]